MSSVLGGVRKLLVPVSREYIKVKTISSCSTLRMRRPLDLEDEPKDHFGRDRDDVKTSGDQHLSFHEAGYEHDGATEKSINQVTLLGRVGMDPQIRGTENSPVTTFSLATNSSWKNQNDEWNRKTEWHNVVVFKPGLRELAYGSVTKGTRLHVSGRLMYGEYMDQKGVKRQTTSIVCEDMIFLSPKK